MMNQTMIENLSTEEYSYFLGHGELEPTQEDSDFNKMLTEFITLTNLQYANQ